MKREEMLSQIQHVRKELEGVLQRLTDDQMLVSMLPNGWSLKDLLGHFGFWENRAVEIYYFFKGEMIPEPKPGTLSLDEINALAFATFHKQDLDTVRSSEQQAYDALIRLLETASDEELFDPQHFSKTEGRAFYNWIEDNSSGHYLEHLTDLRAVLNLPGWIQYSTGDQVVRAYTACSEKGGPGIIVLHAWWGLNVFFQRFCDRLAEQGFAVLAPDLYGDKLAVTIDEAEALMKQRDSAFMQTAVFSAVERLRQQPGVHPGPLGVIGFSMGAAWAIELSAERPSDIAACVLFYGAGEADFQRAQAAYQGHFAEEDEWEPIEGVRQMVEQMKTAGRETEFHFYPGTGHWFFENDRPDAYHAEAARLAWERALAFLKAKIGA